MVSDKHCPSREAQPPSGQQHSTRATKQAGCQTGRKAAPGYTLDGLGWGRAGVGPVRPSLRVSRISLQKAARRQEIKSSHYACAHLLSSFEPQTPGAQCTPNLNAQPQAGLHERYADCADLPDDAVAKVEPERLAHLNVVRDAKVWDLRRLDCTRTRAPQSGATGRSWPRQCTGRSHQCAHAGLGIRGTVPVRGRVWPAMHGSCPGKRPPLQCCAVQQCTCFRVTGWRMLTKWCAFQVGPARPGRTGGQPDEEAVAGGLHGRAVPHDRRQVQRRGQRVRLVLQLRQQPRGRRRHHDADLGEAAEVTVCAARPPAHARHAR